MSVKKDSDYLRDMLEYAEDAHAMTQGHSEADLDADHQFRFAIQYCILIIGEAASKISEETRNQLPKVPWREITGMRNWLVHGYSGINAKTVWQTATQNLPALIEEILNFLPPEQT